MARLYGAAVQAGLGGWLMARIPSTGLMTQPPRTSSADAINDIDLGTFLELMITELQNQDPLNPLDNKDMLAQISQIREVGATDRLTATLESVLLGQNIASSTNLIGSDVDAISDDNQPVAGTVSSVSIENGEPKLHVELATAGEPSIEKGGLQPGEYSYRVVWRNEKDELVGIELAGDDAISTVSGLNDYQSIRLNNLPVTDGPKQIYRTNKSGEGEYQLVTTLTDGKQSSYLDTKADVERSPTRQTESFKAQAGWRSFLVSLNNVSEIRAPERTAQ
jgi:flagellar basal-body rod modification protein FlgD